MSVRVSPQTSDREGEGAAANHKVSFNTKQNDFANVRDSDEFIGEDPSGPAGHLIVTIEEGCRSVVKTSTAAAVRAPTAPEACLPAQGYPPGPRARPLLRGCRGEAAVA